MGGPPPAPVPPPEAASRAAQWVLAGAAALALVLLGFRGYGSGLGVRPTEQELSPTRVRIDLNAADKPELLQVPGIGPGLADAILSHRREAGGFGTVDDLGRVKGIGGKTLDKLRPWVTVGPADAPAHPPIERLERKPVPAPPAPMASRSAKLQPGEPPLDVNAADEPDLQRLPGVGPTLARRIVEFRGRDRFKKVDDLRRVKGIGAKTLESLRPYVVCR